MVVLLGIPSVLLPVVYPLDGRHMFRIFGLFRRLSGGNKLVLAATRRVVIPGMLV